MKNRFYGLFAVAALAAAMASTASASELLCAGVSDVTTIAASGGCTVAGSDLTFNNFIVSPIGFSTATVGIGPTAFGTGVSDESQVDLSFQVGGISGPGALSDLGDVEMEYTVTGGIEGIDLTLQASELPADTGTGFVQITEVACRAAFVLDSCPTGDTLANYVVVSTGNTVTASANFAPPGTFVGTVFIKKDIDYSGATTSEFVNSQAIPEPMTLTLMGAGLLGLGLMGRRRVRK
jgi:hypothetical protein